MDIQKLLKQAQQMQSKLAESQAKLAQQTVETEGAGGKVKIVATCDGMLESITIDPSILDPNDVDFLQDLLLSTINGVITMGREHAANEMKKVSGGLGLPPGMM